MAILKIFNKLLNKPKKLNPKIFQLMEQGNREALTIYINYCHEFNLPIDSQLCTQCIFTSAEQYNNANSLYDIGNHYFSASNGFEKNDTLAIDYFLKAASLNNTEAMNQLAYIYHTGSGVEKNENTMLEWYKKAASLGCAKALTNLGNIYAKGIGVEQSFQQAKIYFISAADKGDPTAMSNLSYLYFNGLGVEKDENEANNWLIKSRKLRSQKSIKLGSIDI